MNDREEWRERVRDIRVGGMIRWWWWWWLICLYLYFPPISEIISVRWTKHARPCWRSKDELMSNVLLQILSHGRASVRRPAKIYLQKLHADTGCSLEDLPEAVDNREARESHGNPCYRHDMMMMIGWLAIWALWNINLCNFCHL